MWCEDVAQRKHLPSTFHILFFSHSLSIKYIVKLIVMLCCSPYINLLTPAPKTFQ